MIANNRLARIVHRFGIASSVPILLAAPGPVARATPIEPWADLAAESPDARDVSSFPSSFTAFGNRVAFVADDGVHGREVWALEDGVAQRLTDLCPGRCGAISALLPLEDRLLVVGAAAGGQSAVWTIGEDGAVDLVQLLGEGLLLSGAATGASGGGYAVFRFDPAGSGGPTTWVTNGEREGTFDCPVPGQSDDGLGPSGYFAVGDEVWFSAATAERGRELWSTDGSRDGLRRRTDVCPGPCGSDPEVLGTVEDRVVFRASSPAVGAELFAIGSEGGAAVLLADLSPGAAGSRPVLFAAAPDRIWVSGIGIDEWVTDGTRAGTRPEPGLRPPGRVPVVAGARHVLGDRIVFEAVPFGQGLDRELWSWNRETAETLLLSGAHLDRSFLPFTTASLGEEVSYWSSDGRTLRATDGVFDRIVLGFHHASPVGALFGVGEALYFARSDETGREPWTSDGTASGTRRLADLARPRASSNPRQLVSRSDGLWVRTEPEAGPEALWRVDAGEVALEAFPENLARLLDTDGRLFAVDSFPEGLWSREPDGSGWTRLLDQGVRMPVALGEEVWFSVEGDGQEVWASDGTPEGTRVVADPDPGWAEHCQDLDGCDDPRPIHLAAAGDAVYYAASGPGEPLALWTTSATGTTRSLRSGELRPTAILPWGREVLVRGEGVDSRLEVWRSDGTEAGTRRLHVAAPGAVDVVHPLALDGADAFVLRNAGHGDELWSTDGTASGTRLVSELGRATGALRADVVEAVVSNGRAFLSVRDEVFGRELWISDGTGGGTFRLDLRPGEVGSGPSGLVPLAGGGIVFAAETGSGTFPWVSDGTLVGTRPVGIGAPGPGGSFPEHFAVHGGRVVFAADGPPELGRELFSFEAPEPSGSECPDGTLCLRDGRFRASIERDDFAGGSTAAFPSPLGAFDSGLFWFFSPENWEVMVKVLDGCAVNGHYWIFAAAITDVGHRLTIEEPASGRVWSADHPSGQQRPAVVDLGAFACDGEGTDEPRHGVVRPELAAPVVARSTTHGAAGSCLPGPEAHCLGGGRFRVEVEWTDFEALEGAGRTVPFGIRDSGLFWFFTPDNWELMVKVLDGCAVNGRYWVFGAATTNVGYSLRVTDTRTGQTWESANPPGTLASAITNTDALEVCP